jgi:hypothetical protein
MLIMAAVFSKETGLVQLIIKDNKRYQANRTINGVFQVNLYDIQMDK